MLIINILVFIIIVLLVLTVLLSLYVTDRPSYPMPIFNNIDELNSSAEWSNYIEKVYLDKPTAGLSNFPVNLSDFFVLYKDDLKDSNIVIEENLITNACPTLNKNNIPSTIMSNFKMLDEGHYWLNKLPPYDCFNDYSYTEVMHAGADPVDSGSWMYQVTGSGVWFNVGKTKCYKKHEQAMKEILNIDCEGAKGCNKYFPQLMSELNTLGYKSIQFTENDDQHCGLRALEIVHVTGEGNFACGFDPNDGDFASNVAKTYKTGWNHTIGCSCDSTKQILNCNLSTAS